MKRVYPNVIVEIHEGIQSSTIGLIRSGQVDFGIAAVSEPHDDPLLRSLPIDPGLFNGSLATMRLKGRPISVAASGFQDLVKQHLSKMQQAGHKRGSRGWAA